MNCHDAREGASATGMGLTERALVHAHVKQCAECRKDREALPQAVSSRQRGTPSRAAWLTRLRALLSISLTLSGPAVVRVFEGVRVGVTRVVDRLTRVLGLLSAFVKRSGRAAASVIGAIRFGITHFAHLGNWLRRSLMIAFQRVARVAIESAGAGVTRVLVLLTRVRGLLSGLVKLPERAAADVIGAAGSGITRFAPLLTRLRVVLSLSFTVSVRAGGRVIAALLVEATRVLDLLARVRWLLPVLFRRSGRAAVRAIGVTRGVGRIVVTTAGGALSLLGARMSPTFGTRPLLKLCTGVVSLAVLVVAILFLWPRQWPDDLMARFSAGERLSRDVRRPVDRNPAELAPAAPLVQTSAPKPVSAPPPAPVEVSPPETPRVAMRRKSPETQAEIPAPLRRPASAPMPAEAVLNAEASDSTAAIDWLLKGGSSRRRNENP